MIKKERLTLILNTFLTPLAQNLPKGESIAANAAINEECIWIGLNNIYYTPRASMNGLL